MYATTCATGTVVPAGASCLSSVPLARATSSITALSVSTSARTSPTATVSPACFFHSTRRPSSMVGESASMTTLVAMSPTPVQVQYLTHCRHDLVRVGLGRLLQALVVRHRYVGAGDPEHRRIQLIERIPLDYVHDLRSDAGEVPAFLDHHAAVGLGDGGEKGRLVERPDGAEVHHLRVHFFSGEQFRGL